MIRNILAILISCAFVTACTPSQQNKASQISSDLLSKIDTETVHITIADESFSPEGKLVLKLNKSDQFSEGATITIPQDHFDKLNDVATTIESMIKNAESNGALPVEQIDLDLFQ